MKKITSRQNPLVARSRAIAAGDDRSMMLLDGLHLVDDALAGGVPLDKVIVATNALDRTDVRGVIERAERAGIEVTCAAAPVMAAISPVRSPSGIVALAARPACSGDQVFRGAAPLVIVACDIQDPGNLGAIARIAEAAGATGMIAAGTSADPYGWKALRGSMGSALRLPILDGPPVLDAVADARRRRLRVVATTPRGGVSLFDSDLIGPVALVIGGEGSGLPDSVLSTVDLRMTIPMEPPVESLNAASTAAVVAYEARRQRQLSSLKAQVSTLK